jgi:hypothetical protein
MWERLTLRPLHLILNPVDDLAQDFPSSPMNSLLDLFRYVHHLGGI